VETIANRILLLRGLRVLSDSDLAAQQNFFTLPQFATSNIGRGGRRHLPKVFTEHSALMAATILNSPRAIEVSVYVIRAFVQLRDLLAGNKELSRRLRELESRLEKQARCPRRRHR